MEKDINIDYISFKKEKLTGFLFKMFNADEGIRKYIGVKENDSVDLILYIGEIIGFSNSSSKNGNLNFQCALLKQFRNRGFGRKILEKVTKECFDEGYSSISLNIEPANIGSIKSAQANGFILDDINEEFNSANKESRYYTFYKLNPLYTKGSKRI